jgi:hypothetical protein
MSQAYHCLPSDLWHFDTKTPKGFFFNRGVYYWANKVEGEMDAVEAHSRKNRKNDASTQKLVTTARLGVLSKHLGVEIKRYKDVSTPGSVRAGQGFVDNDKSNDGKGQIIMSGF